MSNSSALTTAKQQAVGFTTEGGVDLKTLDDALAFGQVLIDSGLAAPRDTPATVVIKIQKGQEVGLSPLDAVASIFVIGQKASVSNEAMLALISKSGVDAEALDLGWKTEGSGNDLKIWGWCQSRRHIWGEARRTEFSWNDAVRAGYTTGNNKRSYSSQPGVMLQWKAVAAHVKKYYGDIAHGLVLLDEAEFVVEAEKEKQRAPRVINLAENTDNVLHKSAPDPLLNLPSAPEPEDAEIVREAEGDSEAEEGDLVLCGMEGPEGEACFYTLGHEGFHDWTLGESDVSEAELAPESAGGR